MSGASLNSLIIGNTSTINGSSENSIALGNNITISGLTNSIGIGNQASPSASNEIRLGNTAITSVVTSGVVSAFSFSSNTANYPDYVFEDYFKGKSKINSNYKFITLDEAEHFVKLNGHLPGVKSYSEVNNNGMKLNITEATVTNLEKIEEQFLYITELNKKIKSQNEIIKSQDDKIKSFEERLKRIENLLHK